jgi:hypothetical protein
MYVFNIAFLSYFVADICSNDDQDEEEERKYGDGRGGLKLTLMI